MKFDSKLIHQPQLTLRGSNRPLVSPVYHSVKYTADTIEELQQVFASDGTGFVYSRVGNPTVRQLELVLADAQGREECVCVGSGLAAISSMFIALLRAGDHIVLGIESYKPTRLFYKKILAKFGVTATFVSITDLAAIKEAIVPGRTRLIAFESPTNPVTRLADVEGICAIAKEAGALTVMDNTFAGFHHHGEFKVDLFLHSLTKFANGHGDAMGGAIIGNKSLIDIIRGYVIELGPCLDAQSAFLHLRGMKTYTLRYERAASHANFLATALLNHKRVSRVLYPGLDCHPDHALARKQMRDFGTILALYPNTDQAGMKRFMNALKMFAITASLGAVESLVAPIDMFYGTDLTDEEKKIALITPNAVRLSIGIEDRDDLLADLNQALSSI